MGPADHSAYSVLVVADRPDQGVALSDGLRVHGFVVSWVRSPAETEIALRVATYDVVLLDGEAAGAGAEPVRRIRASAPGALLLVVKSGGTEDELIADLDAGADDHVARPISLPLLIARLRAQLRRVVVDRTEHGVIAVDGLTVDAGSRRCHVGSREVTLRAKEFDLLWLLVQHCGSVVTRLELMSEVWDENWSGSTKTLDVTMAGLRRHLREVALAEGVTLPPITTMRGHGYRLDSRAVEVEAG